MDARLWSAIQRPQTATGRDATTPHSPVLGSGLITGAARRLGGMAIEALFNPVSRLADYGANMMAPIIIPDLGRLLELHYSGYLDYRQVVALASMLGIHLANTDLSFDSSSLPAALQQNLQLIRSSWQGFIEQNRPYYPIQFLRKLTRQGVLPDDRLLRAALKREGFSLAAIQDLYINEYELLNESTLLELYFRKLITLTELNAGMLRLGWRDEDVQRMLNADYEIPAIAHALSWWTQGLINESGAREIITATGWQDGHNVDMIAKGRFTPPAMADLMMFGGIVAAGSPLRRLITNGVPMPDWLKTWANRIGYGMSSDASVEYGTADDSQSFARVAWDNHWLVPTIPLLSQFLHRFRGDPNDQSTWSVQGVQPLTLDEASACLTANGVADSLKPYIFNLMYSPLGMRHINMVAKSGTVGVPWIAAKLLDNGLSPADAGILAPVILANAMGKGQDQTAALLKRALSKLVSTIERSYEVGTLARPVAQAELVANGIPAPIADTMLATVDLEVANRTIEQVVRRAKSDVFAGRTTMAAAQGRLVQAGMAHDRVAQIIAGWSAEFGEGRKHVATSQILRYLRKGFLTRDQALLRLSNIGWAGGDMLLLLSDVQQQVAGDTARSLAAAEREKVQEERAIQTQLDRTVTLWDRLISRMKVLTPPAKVVKWYKDGLWSETRTRERLRLLGYTDDVIDTMLLEALHVGPKKPTKPKGSVP